MLPRPKKFAIYPSVIPANVQTEMVIVPCERVFLLRENETYQLTIIHVDGDEPEYIAPTSHNYMTAVAHDGVLRFSYTFPGEQEHLIVLSYNDCVIYEFTIFSLYEDLYSRVPLKGDLHSHSHRSDGKHDPAAIAGHFREQGYDFFALTDHNRFYPGEEIDEVYQGVKLGLTRIRGEEVHPPKSVVHIVHVGGHTSVAELYVHDSEGFEKEISAYEQRVPEDIPEKYRGRYARSMWATDKIHEVGGLAILPHPYWRPGKSRMYNICEELAGYLLESDMFDAYELSGEMKQQGVNVSVALWAQMCAKNNFSLPVVGSSDMHSLEKSGTFAHSYTLCFAGGTGHDDILSAVKDGWTVVVEDTGTEYERECRCYGSLRLVTYAHFLLNHFFLERQRICQGEGVAMRQYAMGIADAALIELQVKQSDDFRDRFFGRKPPVLPDKAMLDFEEKWRERQMNGPLTKGASLSTAATRQI